jgi:hypothetical protein
MRAGTNGVPGTTTAPDVFCQETQGPKPAAVEVCNTAACADTTFTLVSFDSRRLKSGIPRTDIIPPGGRLIYSYQRPTAAAAGVCITVQPQTPDAVMERTCEVEGERKAAGCLAIMRSCHATAVAEAALQASLLFNGSDPRTFAAVTSSYMALAEWSNKSAVYATPAESCNCFEAAQECLAAVLCNHDVQLAAVALAELCTLGVGCTPANCNPQSPTRNFTDAAAPAKLAVFATPYSTLDESSNAFLPPVDSSLARWGGSVEAGTGEQRLVIYGDEDGYTDLSADTLAVVLHAPNASVKATITMTALSAFPVSVSGSLAAIGGATAAQVRAGGLQLILSTSCDVFVEPSTSLYDALLAITNVTDAAGVDPLAAARLRFGNRISANMMAAGLISLQTLEQGWNRIARPLLLNAATPRFAAFSYGGTRLTLTLPPIPGYYPTSDEQISIAIPGALLLSGSTTSIPAVSITIRSEARDCQVSGWGPWSSCSAGCGAGQQMRYRRVLQPASGAGAACPELEQRRVCNECDPCASVTCLNGGLCSRGTCACPPAFRGVDCGTPNVAPSVPFWLTQPYGRCSAQCEGGFQTRAVICMLASRGLQYSIAPSTSACTDAGLPAPVADRPCNPQPCTEARLDLQLPLPTVNYSTVASNPLAQGGFAGGLVAELAQVLRVSPLRIVFHGAAPALCTSSAPTTNTTLRTSALPFVPLWEQVGQLWDGATSGGSSTPASLRLAAAASGHATVCTVANVSVLPPSVLAIDNGNATSWTDEGAQAARGLQLAAQHASSARMAAVASRTLSAAAAGTPNDVVLASLAAGAASPSAELYSLGSFVPQVAWGSSATTFALVAGAQGAVVSTGALSVSAARPQAGPGATPSPAPVAVGGGTASPAAGTGGTSGTTNGGAAGTNASSATADSRDHMLLIAVLGSVCGLFVVLLATGVALVAVRRGGGRTAKRNPLSSVPVAEGSSRDAHTSTATPFRANPLAGKKRVVVAAARPQPFDAAGSVSGTEVVEALGITDSTADAASQPQDMPAARAPRLSVGGSTGSHVAKLAMSFGPVAAVRRNTGTQITSVPA